MDTLVSAHSLLRWFVLLAALAAIVVTLVGWVGPGLPEATTRRTMLAYAIILDVQVLLGIVIWVTGNYWAGGGHQFQLEHPLIMLIALAVAHIAAARARRASSAFRAARIRAIGVIVSLALILVGIPWTR